MNKPLEAYRAKRDFKKTPEPAGGTGKARPGNSYVIQKHAARRLHYDFRLELDGVLKSWAVPEGPSLNPGIKRLAVHVEDHPLEYGGFEGVIPQGEYGGGTVMIWDRGSWEPEYDADAAYKKGHLKFRLDGEKLRGQWHLVRMARRPREKQEGWLLFKSEDEEARSEGAPDILTERPESVVSGRTMEEIASDKERVWSSRSGGEISKPAKKKKRVSFDASKVPKAKPALLPRFVEPALPFSVTDAPKGAGWVHEIKYDGYRVEARVDGGRATLLTRSGLDWNDRFRPLVRSVSALPVKSALIDGEIVVETDSGVASFTALVDALQSGKGNLVLYAFDLLFLDGFDLREAALTDRKEILSKVVEAADNPSIRYSEHIAGEGDLIFRHAGRLGLEGIVSKRANAPYRSGRVKTWLKVKAVESGPFVIAGYIVSTVDPHAVGALVLGEFVDGKLTPSGHVGSGFTAAQSAELYRQLQPLRTKTPAFKDETAVAKGAKWVEPQLVAEVEYRTRTGSDIIRHAVFRSINEDCDPGEVVRPATTGKAPDPAPKAPPVKLTNPARMLWPEEGVTKQGLADYYVEIADWILPHIVGRPLSLVRCPAGVHEQCFYAKHRWAGLGKAVRSIPVPGDVDPMLEIDGLEGLLEMVQSGVLEIHPWGARTADAERPDRITIDLDPGDNVPWERVVEAALDVRRRLKELGLESFVKTTGGKGLHIVFPILPEADWDTAKAFAQSIAERMTAAEPDRYTDNMAKRARGGRIYVDYLRNGLGATAVGAYSTRARPGATVSTPLAWDELGPDMRPNRFTVENLPKRLAFLDADPWEGMGALKQRLPKIEKTRPEPAPAIRTPTSSKPTKEQASEFRAAPPKEQLVAYWKAVGPAALAYLVRRPLRLVRPRRGGIDYFYGHLPALPGAVHTVDMGRRDGGDSARPWIDSVEGLLGLVEIDAYEIHAYGVTIDDLDRPDMLMFGISPGPKVPWPLIVEAAQRLRGLLQLEGLESWPKLTGWAGVDVMVPVEPDLDWDEAFAYAKELAEKLARTDARYETTRGDKERPGKLLIDASRNARGTTIGTFSPRAREGFPVAAPADWDSLEGLRGDAYSMADPPPFAKKRGRRAK